MTKVQTKLRRSANRQAEPRSRRAGREERAKILRVQNLLARAHSSVRTPIGDSIQVRMNPEKCVAIADTTVREHGIDPPAGRT